MSLFLRHFPLSPDMVRHFRVGGYTFLCPAILPLFAGNFWCRADRGRNLICNALLAGSKEHELRGIFPEWGRANKARAVYRHVTHLGAVTFHSSETTGRCMLPLIEPYRETSRFGYKVHNELKGPCLFCVLQLFRNFRARKLEIIKTLVMKGMKHFSRCNLVYLEKRFRGENRKLRIKVCIIIGGNFTSHGLCRIEIL